VAVLLNAKLRMIEYHVVSVGSLNEALYFITKLGLWLLHFAATSNSRLP
jgi:hypothetical protein